jgi:hypothetical protein
MDRMGTFMTLLLSEIDKYIDEWLTILENTNVKGELKVDNGESLTGSIQTQNGVVKFVLNDKIIIEKNIDELREKLKKEAQGYFDKTATDVQNKTLDFIKNIFGFMGAMKFVGIYVIFLIPVFFRNSVSSLLLKISSAVEKIKQVFKPTEQKIKTNATGWLEIIYKGKPHLLKVKIRKGQEKIKVIYDKKKYEISVTSGFSAVVSAMPILEEMKSMFEDKK